MAEHRMEAEERRAQVVAVARRLFADGGYQTTTTRELARAAGVSDALLYRHFSSKEDVLRGVVDQGIAGFAAMGAAAMAGREASLPERLRTLGRTFIETVSRQQDLLVLFVAEHRLLADDARLVTFIDLAATGLASELTARAQDGEVRADLDGYVFARSFMGALVAFVLLQQVLGMDHVHPMAPERYLDELVETYARGAKP